MFACPRVNKCMPAIIQSYSTAEDLLQSLLWHIYNSELCCLSLFL